MRKYALYIFIVGLFLCLYGVLQVRPVRWDMTDDKHYSLSEASKSLLRQTDEPIEVTLLLEGDLNAGFRRLKKATEETIAEMNVFGDVRCTMYDVQRFSEDSLTALGLRPIVIHEREQNGKTAQTTVYPYAIMQYKGKRAVVTLLKNTRGLSGEENLNASIEQLEFAFMEALHLLQQTETPRVAILEGHGEPDEAHTYDLMSALSKYFQVDRGSLVESQKSKDRDEVAQRPIDIHILDGYKAILIIDPQTPFSEQERFIIDQYIMRGGAVLWAVNGVRFSEQVLQSDGFTPILPLEVGLTDMLFRYGVRVNPALVQDIQCLPIPVNVSSDPAQPNLQPMPWTYAPLLLTSQKYPSEIERCTKIGLSIAQLLNDCISPEDARSALGTDGGSRIASNLDKYFNTVFNSVTTDITVIDFEDHKHAISYVFQYAVSPARGYTAVCQEQEDGTLTLTDSTLNDLKMLFASSSGSQSSDSSSSEAPAEAPAEEQPADPAE